MQSGTFRKPQPRTPASIAEPAPVRASTERGGTLHMLPLGPREERLLLDRLHAGERQAFEMLYHHYVGRVLGLTRHMLRDPGLAEDATQETFIRVYRSVHRFRGESRLATWIHRIATNVCLTELERRKKRDQSTREQRRMTECAVAAPERRSRCDLRLSLSELLDRLPAEKRLTFYLCHVEGLSAQEIAKITDDSTAAVHKRLQRTRRELHQMWTEAAGGDDAPLPKRGTP